MSAWRTALRLEWRLLGGARLVVPMLLVLTALCAAAGWRGGTWLDQQNGAIAEALQRDRAVDRDLADTARQLNRGVLDDVPWWKDARGAQAHSYLIWRHAALPPLASGFVAAGQSDLQPYLHRVLPHPRDRWAAQQDYAHPWRLALGRFDLAFIVVWLLPLLALALLAPSLAADREARRLGLLTVQAGRPWRLVRARLSVRVGVILVTALAALLTGAACSGYLWMSTQGMSDVALQFLLALGYLCFWCGLTLLCSAWAASQRVALLLLGGLWLCLTMASPLVLHLGAELRHPGPSPLADFLTQRELIQDARDREMELLEAYLRDHVDLAANPAAAAMLKPETLVITQTNLIVDREVRPAVRAIQAQADALAGVRGRSVTYGQWLAPGYVVWKGLSELSGTSASRYRAFERQLFEYHARLADAFFPDVMRRATLAEPLQAPHFTFEELDRAPIRYRAVMASTTLTVLGAGFVGVALVVLRRTGE